MCVLYLFLDLQVLICKYAHACVGMRTHAYIHCISIYIYIVVRKSCQFTFMVAANGIVYDTVVVFHSMHRRHYQLGWFVYDLYMCGVCCFHIQIHIRVYTYIYIYIYIEREREILISCIASCALCFDQTRMCQYVCMCNPICAKQVCTYSLLSNTSIISLRKFIPIYFHWCIPIVTYSMRGQHANCFSYINILCGNSFRFKFVCACAL